MSAATVAVAVPASILFRKEDTSSFLLLAFYYLFKKIIIKIIM